MKVNKSMFSGFQINPIHRDVVLVIAVGLVIAIGIVTMLVMILSQI
jgi:hypothetical protein